MSDFNFPDLKLMITGPTYIRPEIREAATMPEFGHRDSENKKRFESIFKNLKKVAQVGDDYEVVIVNGSGSNAMECSIRSMVSDTDKLLNVSIGAFGDLYGKIAKGCGKNVENLKFEAGRAIDMAVLEAKLKEYQPNVVSFTHNETSTGVENNVPAVCKLIQKYGAIALVDGVSIFGGSASGLTEGQAMTYSTACQKSLALPAGFGLLFVHKDAFAKMETVENRGYTTDILANYNTNQKYQILTTPNTTLANQMVVQLDYIVNVEGVENRFARHIKMRNMVLDWAKELGEDFELFAQEGYESPTLTSVLAPKGLDLKAVKEEMRANGYLFDPGYGGLNKKRVEAGEKETFRIGHMGDITEEMLAEYLVKLKAALVK